jgi:hypothetical protein
MDAEFERSYFEIDEYLAPESVQVSSAGGAETQAVVSDVTPLAADGDAALAPGSHAADIMFVKGQDIEVRFDMPTGTVWRRGKIIQAGVDSKDEMTYVVLVRWEYPNDGFFEAQLAYTAEDIANGLFRHI